MPNKGLVIINNEKISKENNSFYCDNVDIKTIPEDLNKNFNVVLIARDSKFKRTRKINIEDVKISSNIFSFLYSVFKTFRKHDCTSVEFTWLKKTGLYKRLLNKASSKRFKKASSKISEPTIYSVIFIFYLG